jgi:beta-glucosidase
VERVYLHNVDRAAAERHGLTVVDRPEDADVAIVRTSTPFQPLHPGYFFGSRQHEGDLDFKNGNPDYKPIKRVSAVVPAVVTVYRDRPAVLTNIRDKAAALVGNFGINDDALLDVLTGREEPEGRLPFELPSSMAAVEAQDPSLPHDSVDPLYRSSTAWGTERYSVKGARTLRCAPSAAPLRRRRAENAALCGTAVRRRGRSRAASG